MMTRSELAKKCGINIETLRYYEKRKLIDPPSRSDAGYRLYEIEDLVKIRFIKNAKNLGFTLKEIAELMKLRIRTNVSCESVLAKARTKREEVKGKINALQSMKKVLDQLVRKCEQSVPTEDCPILESFESTIKFKSK